MVSSKDVLSKVTCTLANYKGVIQAKGLLEEPLIRIPQTDIDNASRNDRMLLPELITRIYKIYSLCDLTYDQEAIDEINSLLNHVQLSMLRAILLNLRAEIYRRIGNLNRASLDIEIVLQLRPDHAFSWLNKANICFEEKDYNTALQAYDICLKLQPDYLPAINNRANTLYYLGDTKLAADDYNLIIKRFPFDIIAHHNYRVVTARAFIPYQFFPPSSKNNPSATILNENPKLELLESCMHPSLNQLFSSFADYYPKAPTDEILRKSHSNF